MLQHLEDLYGSVNQYFSNDQMHIVLKNHAWVKDLFKVQDRSVGFSITELIAVISDSVLQLLVTFKKLSLVEF